MNLCIFAIVTFLTEPSLIECTFINAYPNLGGGVQEETLK